MDTNQLEHIFKNTFNFEDWKSIIKNYFKNTDFYRTPIESIDKSLQYHQVAKSIKEFGSARLADDKIIKFYDIELEDDKHVTKNRVGLRNLIHGEVIPGDVDAILAVFHTKEDKDWRLTFISKSIYWDDDFNEKKQQTSPRRYTYVLGEDESVKTAVKQFAELEDKQINIKHLIEVFNVEKLNKKFFVDYVKHYNKFWNYLLDTPEYSRLFSSQDKKKQEKKVRDFTKKLLGRIVFLHFLQKKGWMGCSPHPTEWNNGKKQFLLELLDGFEDKNHFHSKCLTTLFFNTLNERRTDDIFKVDGLINGTNNTKIPYLNGGLFETDTQVNARSIDFPESYFQDLFDFFGQYNFTIDENSPDDHEVGIDPEMLGHIFENLLEDNKDKGAFYTPKEIVQYMTQESLIQYLQTHLGEHYEIENFIRNHDKGDEQAKENFIRDNAKKIEELLDNVKICDPAIGSGAFPMGMLQEIFKAKMALDWTLERSEVKKGIIQNSIYGVDLESGAVDIARLRFWLALVVDEERPQALPNLDYKIMQGNSLLESFEGIDLSKIQDGVAIEIDTENSKSNLFSQELKKKKGTKNEDKLEDLIHLYFDLDDPKEKKKLHSKIDKQVLNNIYFILDDHFKSINKDYKRLHKKIKDKSANLKKPNQKIKYETESKDAKNLKKLYAQIQSVEEKQVKLQELYLSNERPFFLWHLMFKEVFDNGGFDIVIGNPPYVQIQKIDDEDFKTSVAHFKTYSRSGDVFCLFYELAIELLKHKGVLSYITSNSWLKTKYGKPLRNYLVENFSPTLLVNFEDTQIFPSATVEVNILIGLKEQWTKNTVVANLIDSQKNQSLETKINNVSFPVSNLESEGWVILNKENQYLKDKITNNTTTLKELNLRIRIGLINGFNDAFIIDTDLKNEIINKCNNCEEIIKPILFGKDLSKYKYVWNDKWIINSHNGLKSKEIPRVNVESDYQTVYNHLAKFKEKLIVRKNKGDHWTNLRNCAYWNEFEQPKILWGELSDKPKFIFDETGIFPDATLFSMTGSNLKCLLGILNSKLAQWFFQCITTTSGMGTSRWKKYKIEQLPISKMYLSSRIELVVDYILSSNNDLIIEAFEEIINALVFELYFPEDFRKANIEILKYVEQEFIDIEEKTEEAKKEIILATYQRLSEKKNPLRNQIKLMKIELKELLNPILSI